MAAPSICEHAHKVRTPARDEAISLLGTDMTGRKGRI